MYVSLRGGFDSGRAASASPPLAPAASVKLPPQLSATCDGRHASGPMLGLMPAAGWATATSSGLAVALHGLKLAGNVGSRANQR